jgi:RNA polymerase sigma factor (sigma-70 family)
LDAAAAHPGNMEEQVIEQTLVGRALEQLPIDYKACLLLHVWAGLTSAEIAQVIGKSENVVRMTLVRARRQFRAAYDSDFGF